MRKLILFLLTSVLAFQGPTSLNGQDRDTGQAVAADSVPADTVLTGIDRARSILVELNADIDSISAEVDRARDGSDEERRLGRARAWPYVEAMQALQAELLALIPTLEAGLPTDSITRAFGSFLSREAQVYDAAIEFRSEQIADLRNLRSSTPPDQLTGLEIQITASKAVLDSILTSKVATLEGVDSLGLDVSGEWDFLDGFLTNWAEGQAGRLQIAKVDRDRVEKQIKDAERAKTPEAEITPLRNRLQATEQRIDGIVGSLNATADLLAQRGFETNQYRQIIIETTGEVTVDILDPQVFLGLVRDAASNAWTWIKDNGPTVLVKFLFVVLSIILFRVGFRVAWWVFRLAGQVKMPKLASDLIGRTLRPVATILGLIAGLWFVGVNPTALITGVGVLGIVIGLALQDSLSNLAAGVFILAHQPYDMGDVVRVGGVLGTVQSMGLANTTIVTFDAQRMFVPNRKIWTEVIANRSAEESRRVEITTRISYQEDVDRAFGVIQNLLNENATVLDEPEPMIYVSDLAESWIEITVQPWVKNADWWTFTTELRRLVRLQFEDKGIEIPYAVREIVGSVEVDDAEDGDSAGPGPHAPGA